MPRRCFISAPGGAAVAPLVQALAMRGWEPYVLSDVARLGTSLTESVQEAIGKADAVIGVLTEGAAASANTTFEIGFAAGLRKPVLLVVSPGANVPSDLASYLYVQAEPENIDAIVLALDNLDRQRAGMGQIEPVRSSARPLGRYSDQLLEEASALAQAPETEFEALIVRAIEAGNAVAVTSAGLDRGFDVGVWSDDLDAIDANPLLIELKRRVDESTVRASLNALHMTPSARAALIVSLDDIRPSEVAGLRWPILWISILDLLRRLRQETFAEVVRDLRNRSVHGLPY